MLHWLHLSAESTLGGLHVWTPSSLIFILLPNLRFPPVARLTFHLFYHLLVNPGWLQHDLNSYQRQRCGIKKRRPQ